MIDGDGNVKLADFGISKSLRDPEQESGSQEFGKSFTVIGTAQYMPPESFNPNKGYNESFDIWSLGCCLYEMVVGEPPFGGEQQQMSGMQAILAMNEIRMRDYFSNDFKRLLYGVLNKDPDQRMTID